MDRTAFTVLLSFGLALLACGGSVSDRPIGPLREVTVVSTHWEAVSGTISSILQQPVLTPQPEPEFRVRVGSLDKFETYSRFRLLLFIGTRQDTLLRRMLGRRLDSLAAGDYGLFKVPNPWAKGQFALIFAARDSATLVPGLEAYAARIRQTLRDLLMVQMAQAVYYEGSDKGLSDSITRRQSFTLDVPKRWLLADGGSDSGFLYIHGHSPDRSVFIYWQDSSRALGVDSLLALRDRLTGRYYDGDSIERGYSQSESVPFLARPALRVTGVWQNDRLVLGGPFVSYAFNYQDRFYLVDGMVFNPGRSKLNALAEVEAVVRTFTPR
jgi:hypothetical protein